MLSLPHLQGPYAVNTDARVVQIGCVALQKQPGRNCKPIGYWSSLLNNAKRKYDTTHHKWLALVLAVLPFRAYMGGSQFTVRTDHDALERFLSSTDLTGKSAPWRLRLSKFEFDVVHGLGENHQLIDGL